MGYHAVCLLEQGKYNRIVGMKGEEMCIRDRSESLDLVVQLEAWDPTKNYQRTGLELSLIHI